MKSESETKMVIILRKDLNMRKGKMISQACHACLKVFFDKSFFLWFFMIIKLTPVMLRWIKDKFTKIVVSVNSEQELLDLYNKAQEANIPSSLIQDCGFTEFNEVPTYTAVAIGPDYNDKIDEITRNLPLL